MSNSPRFLVAKYIPDLSRMEPHNIGIILWSQGHTVSRFIGDDSVNNGTLRSPRFVRRKNHPVYNEWVVYWRRLLNSEALPAGRGNTKVPRSSSEFLDALKAKSKENFVLVPGGFIPVTIPPSELPRIADELFAELVADGIADDSKTESRLLKESTRRFVRKSGLKDNPQYQERYPLQYTWHGVTRNVEFTCGIGGGGTEALPSPFIPSALFQTARLLDMKDVNNALFLLEGVTSDRPNDSVPKAILSRNRCGALVYSGNNPYDDMKESLASLAAVSTVIDLSDMDSALAAFNQMDLSLNI